MRSASAPHVGICDGTAHLAGLGVIRVELYRRSMYLAFGRLVIADIARDRATIATDRNHPFRTAFAAMHRKA